MKIIEQRHEILSIPENPLILVEQSGRTCYKSEDKIGCTEKFDEGSLCPDMELDSHYEYCINTKCYTHSSHKFVKMLRDRGHHAMLEFGEITVKFITNRGVTHELVRHRLFSFAMESTRYVRYDGKMEFIRPVWWEDSKETQQNVWLLSMKQAEDAYCILLQSGWRPEQAREVLPNSLKTEIVVKGNFREWVHCLKLRTSKGAHPQIRNLMLPLLEELQEKVPIIFDNIGE